MATKKKTQDDDEETLPKKRAPQPPRLSLTIPEDIRRDVRLAAALSDLDEPEFVRVVLVKAARATVLKHFPNR
jgi:uncharacterized protein (DUF1778 family)